MSVAILVCILALPFVIYGVVKRNLYSLKLLLLMCFFQNIFLVIISPYIDRSGYNVIVLIKEIYVALTVLIGVFSNSKIKRFDAYCYICIIILLLCSLIHSGGSVMQILVSVRQLYLPFLFYLFARQIKLSEKEFFKFIKFYVALGIFSCVFGYIELLGGDSFWQNLHYEEYSMIKIGEVQIVNGFYNSVAMYTYDLYIFFHQIIKRMSSILVDPVILGQLLSLVALFLFSVNGLIKRQKFWFCIVAISLLLTYAKGGIVIAMLTGAVLVKKIYKQRQVGNILLVLGVAIFIYALMFSVEVGSSGSAHLDGLLDHLINFPQYPFGSGIGSEGNLAINMAGLETENSGESFVGTVIGQLGIGVILYIIYAYYLCGHSKTNLYYNKYTNNIIETTRIATCVLFLTSLINNTAISFTSCFIFIIILGIQITPEYYEKENNFENSIWRGMTK